MILAGLLVRLLSLFVTVTSAEEVGVTYPTDKVMAICESLDTWPDAVTPSGRLTVGDVPKPDPETVTCTFCLPTNMVDGEMFVIVGFLLRICVSAEEVGGSPSADAVPAAVTVAISVGSVSAVFTTAVISVELTIFNSASETGSVLGVPLSAGLAERAMAVSLVAPLPTDTPTEVARQESVDVD